MYIHIKRGNYSLVTNDKRELHRKNKIRYKVQRDGT